MSVGSHGHNYNHRYSRPTSLSTIGSNEEADFSTSRRGRQTFHSTFVVSPLVEYHPTGQFYPQHSTPIDQPPTSTLFGQSKEPIYSPAHEQELALTGSPRNRQWTDAFDATKAEAHTYLEKPLNAYTRASPLILPRMERTETGLSVSTGDYEAGPPVKYMKTRYMWMLLQLDQIPWWHNTLVAAAAWIVLAAYLVVPGSFTSFSNSQKAKGAVTTNTPQDQIDAIANQFVASVDHLGLLIFSALLATVGIIVCAVMFLLHWQNYVWLSWKIFQPMTLNAAAGLLTTVVNVMTQQKGVWSTPAKVNASVTGVVVSAAGGLFILYNFFLIEGVRRQHRKHFPVDAELVDPIKKHRVDRYLPNQKGF